MIASVKYIRTETAATTIMLVLMLLVTTAAASVLPSKIIFIYMYIFFLETGEQMLIILFLFPLSRGYQSCKVFK